MSRGIDMSRAAASARRLTALLLVAALTLAWVQSTTPGDPPQVPSVRLMAVGDLMLGWEVGRRIVGKGPAAPWSRVQQYLDQAEILVGNLECVLSVRGDPWPGKLIHLRAPTAAAASLASAGFDVVSVANNHALDFGPLAFGDTLSALDDQGIEHSGGGPDENAARAPVVITHDGLRVAFLSYVLPFASRPRFSTRQWAAGPSRAGLALGTPESVRGDVTLAHQIADVVVVMVHGGVEYRTRPIPAQREFAQAAIDAGASLVLGAHPHVLQGYARRGNTLVAFSLGNFVFSRFNDAANDSAILDVTLTAEGVQTAAWIPLVIERGLPRPAVGAEIDRVMSRLPAL
jgi:poly-gamma-glutamate capsule biosynthesis protein CapA/YwtB (metallophosphatase superfamily)